MKFYIHRLGCPKNDVDADYLAARLIHDGHEYIDNPQEAEAVIVNTCGFIWPAREQGIEDILYMSHLKSTGQIKKILATGCMSQRFGKQLKQSLPELDAIVGVGEIEAVANALNSDDKLVYKNTPAAEMRYIAADERMLFNDYPYAYLKISDGCSRPCAFCSIPLIRGKYRSRPVDKIVREAEFLAKNGKKEIILVSQEATMYGQDLPDKVSLLELMQELEKIPEVKWLRLLYLYPSRVDENLIKYLADPSNKTLNYFDLPLQHISDNILSLMQRYTSRQEIENLLNKIRTLAPEATVRTAFIVGFPGETDEDFEELKQFIKNQQFERLGVFTFSPEEGTSAEQLPDQVPDEIKYQRMDELMLLQQEIAFDKNISLIGSIQEVIIDAVDEDGEALGRTRADCPEIDQEVVVYAENLEVGRICKVRIEAVDGYDLFGHRIEE